MGFFSLNKKWIHLVAVAPVFMTACAHFPASQSSPTYEVAQSAGPKTVADLLQQDSHKSAKSALVAKDPEIIVQGIKLKNTHFDYPVTVNTHVERWIDYFCGRGRAYFEKYLARSEFFIPYIVPILKQNGVPEDLVYLAMIESGFNNLARSRARAVGPWQFISPTGKRYGLMVNWWIDERRDIGKSTLAAVGYLKDLFNMFQSWELAAAAYNAGESKIARAVQRFGTRDFWVISQHRFLRPETRNYVPKIMAAAIISKNRAQFGFPETQIAPAADEVVAGDGELVKLIKADKPVPDSEYQAQKEVDAQAVAPLAGLTQSSSAPVLAAGLSHSLSHELLAEDDFDADDEGSQADLSPALLKLPAQAGASLDQAIRAEAGTVSKTLPLARTIQTPHVTKKGEVGGEELTDFEVQSPADLLKVARAAGLSYQTVKSLNPEILRWCSPPTVSTYRIKLPAFVKDRFLMTYNHDAFPRQVQFMTYKVHRGETLTHIAQHFGINVDPMSDLNRMSPRIPLRNGYQVLLPIPNDRSRTFASLELKDPPERRRRRHSHRRHRRNARVSMSNNTEKNT